MEQGKEKVSKARDEAGIQPISNEPSYNSSLDRTAEGRQILGYFFVLAALIVSVLIFYIVSPFIGKKNADLKIESLCEQEGGIRVVESVQLESREFATIDSVDGQGEVVGNILEKYRVIRRHEFNKIYSAAIYKYTTSIERIADGVRISEMIRFHREGDEFFKGKTCPAGISDHDLVRATFHPPSGQVVSNRDFPSCGESNPKNITLTKAGHALTDSLKNLKPDLKKPMWQREIMCNGKTEIDSVYTKHSGGTRLTGTRLLFDNSEGMRCQAQAMADPDRIICSRDGIYLIGRKTVSLKDNISIEKFSTNGKLTAKADIEQSDTGYRRIIGYRETGNELAIDYVSFGGSSVECKSIIAKKSKDDEMVLLPAHEDVEQYLPGCARLRLLN